MSLRKSIFLLIDENEKSTIVSRYFNVFIVILIILNVLSIVLESFESIHNEHARFFYYFEFVSVAIFTLEYILRLITSDYKFSSKKKLPALLKFIVSPIALIDLFAILPFYLPLIFGVDLRFIRILRIVRVSRLFKLNRYSKSLKLLQSVVKETFVDISITFFIASIVVIFASILMYEVEHDIQPDKFPNVLASMWWAVATLTTVGYGDVFPLTDIGKIISSFIAVLGIGLIAIPTGIISAAFLKKFKNLNEEKKKCPHCRKDLY